MIWHSVHNYETCLLHNFSCYEMKLISPVISIIPHLFYFIVTSKHTSNQKEKLAKYKSYKVGTKKRYWRLFANRQNSCFLASPSHLHLKLFSWHTCQFCLETQRKHLQAANRNATMGCPPGNRTTYTFFSSPLAATKKLGGALWAPPGYTPLPITSTGCNARTMQPVFVHAVHFFKLSPCVPVVSVYFLCVRVFYQ
jgi:hypothetical protein